jgi:hypothetical protein
MAVEEETGMEEMISLIEDYRDGDIKKGELYHKARRHEPRYTCQSYLDPMQ